MKKKTILTRLVTVSVICGMSIMMVTPASAQSMTKPQLQSLLMRVLQHDSLPTDMRVQFIRFVVEEIRKQSIQINKELPDDDMAGTPSGDVYYGDVDQVMVPSTGSEPLYTDWVR